MATAIGIVIVLILAVGTVFYSFFPEDEPIEKAKMRRKVVKINLESLDAGGRTLATRRGAFYIVCI